MLVKLISNKAPKLNCFSKFAPKRGLLRNLVIAGSYKPSAETMRFFYIRIEFTQIRLYFSSSKTPNQKCGAEKVNAAFCYYAETTWKTTRPWCRVKHCRLMESPLIPSVPERKPVTSAAPPFINTLLLTRSSPPSLFFVYFDQQIYHALLSYTLKCMM